MAVIGQGLLSGLSNYNFAAIMFYFLLGEIMNGGGMSNRLIKFGTAVIGHIRGSLSHLNILASMIFAGVSGSAVADTAAIGSLLIPAMKKEGYSGGYAAAVTASSSTIGPIIPPSGGLVLMGIYLSVSINRLFLGGMVPGASDGGGSSDRILYHFLEAQLSQNGLARLEIRVSGVSGIILCVSASGDCSVLPGGGHRHRC